jgi:L-alanine-DL-glutamate epimerase-like enolase superfamily enzyme
MNAPDLETLMRARDGAGERYRVAIAELRAAAVELASLDMAAREQGCPVPSFLCAPEALPVALRHERFADGRAWRPGFADDVRQAAAAVTAKINHPRGTDHGDTIAA